MTGITEKTLQDLQFPTIREAVSALCQTGSGRAKAANLQPFGERGPLMDALARTNEYLSSFENGNALPGHSFEPVHDELKFLAIEGSALDPTGFGKLAALCETTAGLLGFLKKFGDYYPRLHHLAGDVPFSKDALTAIGRVIDKHSEIRDDASPALAQTRREMGLVRTRINQSFTAALSHYNSLGYLDDIRESFVQNRRVLAVLAMYRRKVKGTLMGSSKTGSIAYVEPEATLRHSRELADLEYEEKEEIDHILRQLSAVVRPHVPMLEACEGFLSEIDLVYAKARYAQQTSGVLPQITENRRLFFRDALHPILLLTNRQKKEKTFAQTFDLNPQQRIIVISGPNAGGKTISLKTVGLLQLMLQSGMLIPVHPNSETFLFDRILTDIGDNQSIENHLSTYSYRLKNMNHFLKKCNARTLFLIDEFGTGSDPELGGALAETFLEEFYHREAFGIITTHYANLKMLANELPNAANANMLFDEKSLEPMYKLIVGQAGSSFTFEVAQKNGIPFGMINRAKKKIEKGKVRFDKTIATLQKERSKLEKTTHTLREEEVRAREENQKMETINARIREKLESYQELYDAHQKTIYIGQKIEDLAAKYFNNKDKKALIGEFLRLVEIENAKKKKVAKAEEKKIEEKKQAVTREVQKQVAVIREEKKEKKRKAQPLEKPKPVLKVGDRVRMNDGKAVGSIDQIEKNKATVNYGLFTSKVDLDQLELVEAKK